MLDILRKKRGGRGYPAHLFEKRFPHEKSFRYSGDLDTCQKGWFELLTIAAEYEMPCCDDDVTLFFKWAPHLSDLEHFFATGMSTCDVIAIHFGSHPLLSFYSDEKNDHDFVFAFIDNIAAEIKMLLSKAVKDEEKRRIPVIWLESHPSRYTRIFKQEFFFINSSSVAYWNSAMERVLSIFSIPILPAWKMASALGKEGYRDALHVVSFVNEMKAFMFLDYLTTGYGV